MSLCWTDTFLPDDGTHPPCAAEDCAEPVARDDQSFLYDRCPHHLLEVTEPEQGTA